MKGYFVWANDDWGDFVHGISESKAKAMMWKTWSIEVDEWTYMRAYRVPEFDNVPITEEAILKRNDGQLDCEGYVIDQWLSICDCSVCRLIGD